ncbi:MAG TPA: hypothetical protein VKB70_05825, partial [Gaiellaceae bacterium]|nr:hypothetical protein [Gaiellaceae bacterium]
FLAPALLVFSAQAGAAKPQANKVKRTAYPIWTLAMAWPRVAYASGKEGNTETIHVWNVVTGKISAVKTKNGFATHHTAQIAIAGRRLAWIRAVQYGNTELDHWLYTAPVGGRPHQLLSAPGYAYTGGSSCGPGGPQIDGLVGDGSVMAVGTWMEPSDGSLASDQQLNLITPRGLRTIATGSSAVVSESADSGHIAVLSLPTPVFEPDYCELTPPTSVAIYSTSGALLKTIALGPPAPTTIGYQLALSGNRLVVLTTGLNEPSGPAIVTLSVYDWTTGELMHTWPVAIPRYPGEVSFSVHGKLAAVEAPYRLHLVDLDTGKDVTIARSGQPSRAAIGAHGLVYALNPHNTGKLVFVPTAKLLALVG